MCGRSSLVHIGGSHRLSDITEETRLDFNCKRWCEDDTRSWSRTWHTRQEDNNHWLMTTQWYLHCRQDWRSCRTSSSCVLWFKSFGTIATFNLKSAKAGRWQPS